MSKIVTKDNYTIGIVGGMGSYATLKYFERILEAFPAERDWERPRVIIDNYSTMPSRVRAVLYNERVQELEQDLTDSVRNLLNAGADRIILACNTSHVFLPPVLKNLPEAEPRIIHIIDAVGREIKEAGIDSVSLMASEGTIDTKIFNTRFDPMGITVNAPGKEDYAELRSFIESIKQKKLTEDVMKAFEDFIESRPDPAVILGCTEFPVLYAACLESGYQPSKKVFDPLQSALNILVEDYRALSEK